MKYIGLLILSLFYAISGILALNGIYIVRNAKNSAYFLIVLGGSFTILSLYKIYQNRNKEVLNLKNNTKYFYFITGVVLFMIVPYFILRELGIYFTDDTSFIIILFILLITMGYLMKRTLRK